MKMDSYRFKNHPRDIHCPLLLLAHLLLLPICLRMYRNQSQLGCVMIIFRSKKFRADEMESDPIDSLLGRCDQSGIEQEKEK